ncbi:hypothetical protein BDV96DRAFT_596969 [Lophiotrema nucula]|uniref:Uncharacterized protein n=1 Tax=Lophiotrema nucula TaxID=690887 RepID=A0A6A5ZG67_9PLEO|nr:hypothetical protein BDV96DRAFT_596969 [Lophiotrema nucula]
MVRNKTPLSRSRSFPRPLISAGGTVRSMTRLLFNLILLTCGARFCLSEPFDPVAPSDYVVVGSVTFSLGAAATIPGSDCPRTKSEKGQLAATASTFSTTTEEPSPTSTTSKPGSTTSEAILGNGLVYTKPESTARPCHGPFGRR